MVNPVHILLTVCARSLTENNRVCSIQVNVAKLDAKRRLRLDRMDKIFHELEVVPLFGDMQIAPFFYVKKMMHFDANKWPLSSQTNAVSPQVSQSGEHLYLSIFVTFFWRQSEICLKIRLRHLIYHSCRRSFKL